jgi:hypothetical protein
MNEGTQCRVGPAERPAVPEQHCGKRSAWMSVAVCCTAAATDRTHFGGESERRVRVAPLTRRCRARAGRPNGIVRTIQKGFVVISVASPAAVAKEAGKLA